MKKWIRSLTSLVMSVIMILGLSVPALASDPDDPLPEPAAEAAESQSAPAPSVEAPKPAEAKPAESKPTEAKPAENKSAEAKPAEAKPAGSKPAETRPAESKSAENKSSEAKSADAKPAENRSADAGPSEAKPAESKPAEAKPADAKPAENKSADAGPSEAKPAESKPAEAKPAENKSAEAKPAESTPAETKPAEAKPAEAKPAETRPAEAKPAEPTPAETKPAESKSSEAKSSETKPSESNPAEEKPAEAKPSEEKPLEPKSAEAKSAEAAPAAETAKTAEPAPVKEEAKPVETSPASEIPESADPVPVAGAPEQAEPAPSVQASEPEGSVLSEKPVTAQTPSAPGEPSAAAVDPPVSAVPDAADAVPEADDASEADRSTETPAVVRAAPVEEGSPVSGEEVTDSEEPAVESDASEQSSEDTAEAEGSVGETDPESDAAEEENADTSEKDHEAEESGKEDAPPAVASAPLSVASVSTPAAADAITDPDPTGASAASSAGSSSSQSSTSCSYTIKDGSHVIVNHTGGSFNAAKGEEVTILAAGLNHVDSISGSGTVKIGGSGILLVDSFDSAALKNMQLMSCTDMYGDKGGSVAVFVKIDEGTYELVNGSVPAILDEEYLVDNISLIVPEGSTVIIGSIGSVKNSDGSYTYYTGDNTGAKNWDNGESAGHLTLGSMAKMIVRGSVTLADTDSRVVDGSIVPTLSVKGDGQLIVDDGAISGGVLDINCNADHTGIITSASSSVTNTLVKMSEHGACGVSGDTNTNGSVIARNLGVSTEEVVTSSGGVTKLNYDKILDKVGSTDIKDIVVELRRKYADGRIITNRFRPTSAADTDKWVVTDADAEGEVDIIKSDLPWPAGTICPYMGLNITNTSVSATLTGILGGNYPSDIDPDAPSTVTIGGTTYVLRATETSPQHTPAKTAPAPVNNWRVIVSESGEYYRVTIYYGAREIIDPGQKMTARMRFTLPADWDADSIFAVFRNANGKLTAFKAVYDAEPGTLRFDTNLTGTFALVYFPFDGKLYSQAFYDALAELEIIQDLPVRR